MWSRTNAARSRSTGHLSDSASLNCWKTRTAHSTSSAESHAELDSGGAANAPRSAHRTTLRDRRHDHQVASVAISTSTVCV
jgi:hypothetical protein